MLVRFHITTKPAHRESAVILLTGSRWVGCFLSLFLGFVLVTEAEGKGLLPEDFSAEDTLFARIPGSDTCEWNSPSPSDEYAFPGLPSEVLLPAGEGVCARNVADVSGVFRRDSLSADSIMALVFDYVRSMGGEIDGFNADIYVRQSMQTRRKNFTTRLVPGFSRMERGEHEYFGEAFTKINHSGRHFYRKEVAAYGNMPRLRSTESLWAGTTSLSIYSSNLFNDRILSPFHRRNRRFYRYTARRRYAGEGKIYASVTIRPRFPNTQLVTGEADVDVRTGRVARFSLRFFYGWASYYISGEMGKKGKESLLSGNVFLFSRFKWFGNRVEEAMEARTVYDFSVGIPSVSLLHSSDSHDLTSRYLLRADTTGICRNRSFFEAHRPYPLLPRQSGIYARAERKDSLAAEQTDTIIRRRRRLLSADTEHFIFDSHLLEFRTGTEIKLPPILTPAMVQWSKRKGVSLQTKVRFRHKFAPQRQLEFVPRVAYSFKEKQIYWRLPLTLDVQPWHNGRLSIEAGGGDKHYNSRQADEVRDRLHGINGYDSLTNIFNSFDFHYYRDSHLRIAYSYDIVPGAKVSMGFRFHRRSLIEWNEVAEASGMTRRLTSFAPRVNLEWTPQQYYYRDHGRPVPLYSKWPTFMVDYERGLRSFGSDTYYERIEADIHYTLPLYALRSLFFRVGGGMYTQRGDDCFLDYDYFRNSYVPSGWKDELSGEFQLLDGHWYNESRHYALASAVYESPMLLFSRIPGLTRVVQKERIYLNLLNVRSLGYYSEWGYGLSTPLLDVAAFLAVSGKNQTGVGFKVLFHFFDD